MRVENMDVSLRLFILDSMLTDCVAIAAMACRQKGFTLEPAQRTAIGPQPPATTAGPVAQWLEPAAHNRLVGGSSPSGPTIYFQYVMMNGGIPISVCRCISGNDECGPIRNLRTTFVRVALETHRDWG